MTDQLPQLIEALTKVTQSLEHVNTGYTITDAKDWPLLIALGGTMGTIIVGLIALMWTDLKSALSGHKMDNEKAIDLLWAEARRLNDKLEAQEDWVVIEMKECKTKCCK